MDKTEEQDDKKKSINNESMINNCETNPTKWRDTFGICVQM